MINTSPSFLVAGPVAVHKGVPFRMGSGVHCSGRSGPHRVFDTPETIAAARQRPCPCLQASRGRLYHLLPPARSGLSPRVSEGFPRIDPGVPCGRASLAVTAAAAAACCRRQPPARCTMLYVLNSNCRPVRLVRRWKWVAWRRCSAWRGTPTACGRWPGRPQVCAG